MSGILQSGLFFTVHRKPKMNMTASLLLVSRNEKSNSEVVKEDESRNETLEKMMKP